MESKHLSRRELLRGLLLAGGAVATAPLLAACAAPAAPTAAPAKPTEAAKPAAAPTTAPAAAATTAPAAAATTAPAAAATTAPAAKPTEAAKPTAAPQAVAIKGTKLNILHATYFVAAGQDLMAKQAKQWGQEQGVDVAMDFLSWPDLQAKIAAAINAGGLDIVQLFPLWPALYADQLTDVSDLTDEIAKREDGYYDWVVKAVKVGNKWPAVPIGCQDGGINFRVSMFKDIGIEDPTKQFPDTWEDLFAAGKKLKAKGKPLGQPMGHSPSDPYTFAYPFTWAYGGMEVDEDGKTVALNKPAVVDAVKLFTQAWKDGYDETGVSWDDSGNNRAFLAGQISATQNGSSIYVTAKKEQPAVAADMFHWVYPKGPAGRFNLLGAQSIGILKNSKNVPAAKEFLRWWFNPTQFKEWLFSQGAYQLYATKYWEKDPFWTKDPVTANMTKVTQFGRTEGWAGTPNDKAALAKSKYILVDMYVKAIQGADAATVVKSAEEELKKIYNP